MKTPNIGVIIQGPLITFGQGPNNTPFGFDSISSILKNIDAIKRLGWVHVVTTWTIKNEREEIVLTALQNAGVPVSQNDVPNLSDNDHRYKQRYGIKLGLDYLEKNGESFDFLLRIRTDMEMPDSFWNWINEIVRSGGDDRLYVSELMPDSFYMGDFIYFGKREVVANFLETICSYGSIAIHPTIAYDDGVKFYMSKNPDGIFGHMDSVGSIIKYFIFFRRTLCKEWERFASAHIAVMPESIWNDIVWRLRPNRTFLKSSSFLFDIENMHFQPKSFLGSINNLIYSFERYFEKRDNRPIIMSLIMLSKRCYRSAKLHLKQLLMPGINVNGRIACVGKDLLEVHFPRRRLNLRNIQKGRTDLLLEWIQSGSKVSAKEIAPFMLRKDVYPLIQEQEAIAPLKARKCSLFIFDTYSDLTDQKFTHIAEGWSFCSHYSDLEHTQLFRNKFREEGLLPLEGISEKYNSLFDWIESKFPGTPIIVVHYSAKFDPRQEFKSRADTLQRELLRITEERKTIINLSLSDLYVEPNERDTFPYHYSMNSIRAYSAKWSKHEQEMEA